MGCGYSEPFEREWGAHYKSYGALRLSKSDVHRLWRVFADIDSDRRGTISYEEFLNYFDFDKSLFVKRAFDVMDEDASGAIGFLEFVVGMWNYCTLDRTAMLIFAFDIFDLDQTGEIDGDEIQKSLLEVYGRNKKHVAMIEKTKEAVDLLVKKTGHGINQARFVEFAKHHSNLLFPVFDLQKNLRQKACGVGFWDKHTSTRDPSFAIGQPTVVLSKVRSAGGSQSPQKGSKNPRAVAPAHDHSLTAARTEGVRADGVAQKVIGSAADRRAAKVKAKDYSEAEAAEIEAKLAREAEHLKKEEHGSGFQHHTTKDTDRDLAALRIQAQARRRAAKKEVEEMRKAKRDGGARGGY